MPKPPGSRVGEGRNRGPRLTAWESPGQEPPGWVVLSTSCLGCPFPSFRHLAGLTPEQWKRGSIHVTLGRMTFADWMALIAAHDDKHLDQLRRALEGRS